MLLDFQCAASHGSSRCWDLARYYDSAVEVLKSRGLATALQPWLPVSMQLKLWHLFFPLQQDMAVPPGSAAACLEEHPAWTEQKLTRTFGAGSGYAGSRPRGIFAFQF